VGPESESRRPLPKSGTPALQSSPKVIITQQAVCNFGFIQLDHLTYSRAITYSNYYLFNSNNE